jgi:hypothetical protein
MDIEADLIPTKDNGGLDMDIDLSRPEATLLHERTVIARLSREDLEDRSDITSEAVNLALLKSLKNTEDLYTKLIFEKIQWPFIEVGKKGRWSQVTLYN